MLEIFLVVGIIGLSFYFSFDWFMWRKIDVEGLLQREIEKKSGTILLIKKAGRFDVGPFPKFEVKAATPEEPVIIIPGMPVGNKTLYKKVLWRDRDGVKRVSRAEMVFVPFYRLSRIHWKDET